MNKKSFFQSHEWQAFIRPFKQLLSIFNKGSRTTEQHGSLPPEEKKNNSSQLHPLAKAKKTQPHTSPEAIYIDSETLRPENPPGQASFETPNLPKTSERAGDHAQIKEENPPTPEEIQHQKELEEKKRREFLLDKFAARQAARKQRQANLDELEETVLEETRTPLAEKQDFPQYSLKDFLAPQEEEKQEKEQRQFSLPEGGFQLPVTTTLQEIPPGQKINNEEIQRKKNLLQDTLDSFRIDAQVSRAIQGPRITRIDIRPAQGVNVDNIANLSKNMAMELAATSLRILAPVPGESFVGVEIPNDNPDKVTIRELLECKSWNDPQQQIPLALGKNTSGQIRILDLAKAPHLLIAGATGAGKSVCINTIVMSMIYRFNPEDLQLILVDPKVVELTAYKTLPHLITDVITDTKKVPAMLKWVVAEMKRRYKILAQVGARNISAFNSRQLPLVPDLDEDEMPIPDKFPFMVMIIDELADIMMTAGAEVEISLAQIAQLSRAVGIHTIVATQRPSVNVITGIIKANFPTRIAFQVSSHIDSRTIIDGKGAEQLLGRGDMLFSPPGASSLERLQGALVEDEEIDECVHFVASQMPQAFEPTLDAIMTGNFDAATGGSGAAEADGEDADLLRQAMEIISSERKASTSYLQRRLRIGYNRAATLMEQLEERGVVGPQIGSAKREIFID